VSVDLITLYLCVNFDSLSYVKMEKGTLLFWYKPKIFGYNGSIYLRAKSRVERITEAKGINLRQCRDGPRARSF